MKTIVVGRDKEKKILDSAYNSTEAEFIAIYGRRRIGKTFLIKEYYKKKPCMFFHVTGVKNEPMKTQLEQFAKILGKVFYGGATLGIPKNWMSALEELTKAINNSPKNKKIVLFFDEFPWMAGRNSGLLQAIDYFWNRFWVDLPKFNLIICGSSSSWIINKVVNNKGGLHNRITKKILLKPFTICETEGFLKQRGIKLNREQVLQLYMALGGVPHYLKHIAKGQSAAQNINNLCFNKDGLLFNEFDEVFSSLFEDHEAYKELISIINKVKTGISREDVEKSNKLTGRGGRLTERLKDLEDSGFISSFMPLGHTRKGIYYRVSDEFCCFYLSWIQDEKKTLIKHETNSRYWEMQIGTPKYNSWSGYVFESLCYKHLAEVRSTLGISSKAKSGVWRFQPQKGNNNSGAQIDLLFERDDGVVTVCEIKYSSEPFAIDKACYLNLLNKIKVYKRETGSKKQIFVAMISANGLKETIYSEEIVTGLVTLDDFFKNNE